MSGSALRHWALPDTHNLRDLGGYATATGRQTQWRRILRGEALHFLTLESTDQLVADGLTLVIDLRGPHETRHTPHPFAGHPDVAYRNIALFDALAPIAPAQAPFDMSQRYCAALDRCGDRIAEVLRLIATQARGMVLFHCTAGKDRTGIIAALVLLIAGVSRDDVVADYALTASAEPLLAKLRANALAAGGRPDHVERVLASDAATMVAMLDHLESAHGGVGNYAASIGLAATELKALADRLCA